MIAGSIAAAAAAAGPRRREEEKLSPSDRRDLDEGSESKFIRSNAGAFSNPDRLRAARTDGSAAGWTLGAKFDAYPIRRMRPASARARDDKPDFDPYRTTFGIGESKFALAVLAIGFASLAFLITWVATLHGL